MRGLLLINPRSGSGGPTADELAAAAGERGVDARVLRQGDDAAALAREAEASALGMAGGDGSLAPVAAVAIERDLPFVCVPFGTRNHFARDAGLDRDDPLGALAAFEGEEQRIDVGRADDRIFLNNVSLGMYARLVHRREHHRRREDALARLRALMILARHPQPLRLSIDGEALTARVVLVANNGYRLDLFSLGERERLDEGVLHLYVPSGFQQRTWTDRTGTRFRLDGPARFHAAIDGEPELLEPPVEFRIEPSALRLLLPAREHADGVVE